MATSQFTIYTSADPSAPQLYGSSGSLVTVLTACLVNGYGSMPKAGWSADYTLTEGSGSTFRPPSGSQFYLCVTDNGQNAYKEARIRGYEIMTAFDTGSGMFPLTGFQGANGLGVLTVKKSNTNDVTASRPWIVAADAYTAYMWIMDGTTGNVYTQGFSFGDIYSIKNTSDDYRCIIVGRNVITDNATSSPFDWINWANAQAPGHFMARSWTGYGLSISVGKFSDKSRFTSANMSGSNAFPNGPDNAIYLSPIYLSEVTGSGLATVRGRLRGIYAVAHQASSFTDGDTIIGTGPYAGKTFRFLKPFAAGTLGVAAIETSNTVETN